MYDSVTFWIDTGMVGDISTILPYLDDYEELFSQRKIKGRYKNLQIRINERGLFLTGSLAKFYFGNNIQTLTRSQVQECIEKLSDELHIFLVDANITRIDFGTNFIMNEHPSLYLHQLGCCSRLIRVECKQKNVETVYYRSDSKARVKPKELCFYDKAKETKDKGLFVKNMLRYELRLRQRLPQQLNTSEVLGKTLFETQFYSKMINLWSNYYFRINKNSTIGIDAIQSIKTVKDALNILFSSLLEQKGQSHIDNFLDGLKQQQIFTRNGDYYRLKKQLNDLVSNQLIENNSLITELDNCIIEIRENAI